MSTTTTSQFCACCPLARLRVANHSVLHSVELPALNTAQGAFVKGVFDVQSTTDISKSCDSLKTHARSEQGGDNKIQGPFFCQSNNDKANEDINNPNGGGGGSNNKNSATGTTINMALFGLSLVAGVASML